ncbi:hypothetical protein E2C01_013983 [Portunus trituberculatus]|uniref:Uncharacterized protein n=1 Tax=Portunus trituberculatus TaxID=210409 RepID=A0A5B7DI08_PORTR|nr:hypothetical protein [Portunus trituberculatus]
MISNRKCVVDMSTPEWGERRACRPGGAAVLSRFQSDVSRLNKTPTRESVGYLVCVPGSALLLLLMMTMLLAPKHPFYVVPLSCLRPLYLTGGSAGTEALAQCCSTYI